MPEKIVKTFRVTMDEELHNKFEAIKKEFGVSADAQVIRIMITRYYKMIENAPDERLP